MSEKKPPVVADQQNQNPSDPFEAEWRTLDSVGVALPIAEREPTYADFQVNAEAIRRLETQLGPQTRVVPLPEQNSQFANWTQQALDLHVLPSTSENPERVGTSGKLACIVIQSKNISGHLVAALGENREIDLELIKKIRTQILSFLSSSGEAFLETEPVHVTLEPVEFECWALDQADFLKKATHADCEIALAFFPIEEPPPEASEIQDMVKLKVENLELDVPLEFDIYLFLPTNHRLLLHTTRGKIFARDRVERLAKSGVTHVHVRQDGNPSVHQHVARQAVRERVATWKANIPPPLTPP